MSRMQEHLLGYLLEALEPAEMAAVESELEQNPQLRKDLAAIEASLLPLGFPHRDDEASATPPPAGIAARACEFVEDSKEVLVPKPAAEKPQPAHLAVMSPVTSTGSVGRRVRWADVVVTLSVCMASAAIVFPAIWTSWQQSHVTACQENLRNLGNSLGMFAGYAPDGRIPAVAQSGNRSTAGIYAALLQESELLGRSCYLICPASELSEQANTFNVPTLAQIDRSCDEALVQMQAVVGGSYGFHLGYLENGTLRAPRHASREHYILMSDAPATFPDRKTRNHRACGSNLLYEDNHVRFVVNACKDLADNPFLNRSGMVAAGADCCDVVVAESSAKP